MPFAFFAKALLKTFAYRTSKKYGTDIMKKGFKDNAFMKSPCKTAYNALCEPQDGQAYPVNNLNGHLGIATDVSGLT